MLDITKVIRTVNAIISRSSDHFISGLTTNQQIKPAYNHNLKGALQVCKLNLTCCNRFYKETSREKVSEKVCPFGFTVVKRSFDISTKYNKISIYSIIDFSASQEGHNELNNLPRHLKPQKPVVVSELQQFKIDGATAKTQHEYLEDLVETLLVGRIGVAIQGLSHQFFTPLQGALSDLQNLKNGDDSVQSIDRLERNFESLNKLATEVQLLLASSEEFNQNMLRRVTVHAMIAEIMKSLESTAAQKNIKLHQGYNQFTKTVHAIPGQLQIVLSNIIHNALKYSFSGFPGNLLPVSIEYEDQNGDFLVIHVENEGCKITKEEIRDRLLFDLGYRGIHSNDRQRKGTGTGLYISDEIARAHGGKIEVDSRATGGNADLGTDRHFNRFSIFWPYYVD